jgi:hypothetical protein
MIQNNVAQAQTRISLIPLSDITQTTTGTGVSIVGYVGEAKFVALAKNVAGTSPTLAIKLQESDDDSDYADVSGATFTTVTDAGTKASVAHTINLQLDRRKRFLRAVATIGGTNSPQFLVGVVGFVLTQER